MLREDVIKLAHEVPELRRHLVPILQRTAGKAWRRVRTYYHASPKRFKHGDILTGGHEGGYGYCHHNVCLTDSPSPHYTVHDKAVEENWFVYEVEPLGRVSFASGNDEFQTKAAKVLRLIGRVKPIFEHARENPSKPTPRPRDHADKLPRWRREMKSPTQPAAWEREYNPPPPEPPPPDPVKEKARERYKERHRDWNLFRNPWPGDIPKDKRDTKDRRRFW